MKCCGCNAPETDSTRVIAFNIIAKGRISNTHMTSVAPSITDEEGHRHRTQEEAGMCKRVYTRASSTYLLTKPIKGAPTAAQSLTIIKQSLYISKGELIVIYVPIPRKEWTQSLANKEPGICLLGNLMGVFFSDRYARQIISFSFSFYKYIKKGSN